MWIVVVFCSSIVFVVARNDGENFFCDSPLPDYYLRKDVFDCVDRFYKPEWLKYSRKPDDRNLPHKDPHVHEGIRANNGEYQHMAAIGWQSEDTIKYMCGGSIILPIFILTAAHCSAAVGNIRPSVVRVGDTDLGSTENDHLAQQIAIRSFRRHPLHRSTRSYHDIALIELEQPIVYNEYVGPACLWLEDHVPTEPMRIVGFGEVQFAAGPSLTLQQGNVSLASRESCSEVFSYHRRFADGLMDSQFCASHESVDACQGDSGGPIEVRRYDMFYRECSLIVGVTSFGSPCSYGSTGIYTKVSNYIDWIESETYATFSYRKCLSRSAFAGDRYDTLLITLGRTSIPYVHLLKNQTIESLSNCAGVLIDDQFVLTSAHCASHHDGTPRNIYLTQSKETIGSEEVIVHPMFKSGSLANDIALLKLEKYLNRNLKPVCLAKPVPFNETSTLLMYHRENSQDKYDIKYKRKYLLNSCSNATGNLETNEICFANSFRVVPTICHLAQGSPILDETTASIPFLYGVVSSRSTECDQPIYGTLGEPHLEWIRSVLVKHQRRKVLLFT